MSEVEWEQDEYVTVLLAADGDGSSAGDANKTTPTRRDACLLRLDCARGNETYTDDRSEWRRGIERARATAAEVRGVLQCTGVSEGASGAEAADGKVNWLRRAVLYEDEDFVALDKPAGMYTESILQGMERYPWRVADTTTLTTVRLLHRLDRDTSGVLLFGKTRLASQLWSNAIRGRSGVVDKRYATVLEVSADAAGTYSASRALLSGSTVRVCSGHGRAASGLHRMYPYEWCGRILHERMRHPVRYAESWFRRADADPPPQADLWRMRAWCKPLTGRTHQIRLHAHALQMPIVGDARYGHLHSAVQYCIHWLHAERLVLSLPSGRRWSVRSPLPSWWHSCA
ncbi:hypothetical protein CDCA_CDCA09G2674 [Cyanidium caldarium]|uniref:Pseudouridine synthase RsuA/RluA-like domain-containing protein n=1 Tax=Cyanidium caldarium TaxID=2771 RepID=A0AAV9IWI7_CYACA|nr:hypothetical protein CDCA_CDCA09G2674 [Cyanidium caldarium]